MNLDNRTRVIIKTWIREIKDALQECSKAEHISEKAERHEELPPDKPVEVRAVIAFDDPTVRDTKAENERQHATQDSIKNATWFAFVAVSIYALITVLMWCQMIKQNRIASAALLQSTESFRIDERAWIEIEPIKGREPVLRTNSENWSWFPVSDLHQECRKNRSP